MDLSNLLIDRLPEVVDFIAKDAAREVAARIESMPPDALKVDDDIGMLVWLRAHVPGEYLAACYRAAPDIVPLLRLMRAAGGKPDIHRAQSILHAEMPMVERELRTIAALTLFYSGEESDPARRSHLMGEALTSKHFSWARIGYVVNFFGARRYAH